MDIQKKKTKKKKESCIFINKLGLFENFVLSQLNYTLPNPFGI